MTWSWKLGRVAGIDFYLHPTLVLLLLVVSLFAGGSLAVLVLTSLYGCVLLHELGHALAARGYGIRTADITLYPIGGVARLERMPRKAGPEILISLAGPAVNLALAGVFNLAAMGLTSSGALPMAASFLGLMFRLNLMLAAFNLIPAFPMDGGRVLRALLSGRWGRLQATELAASLGKVLAVAFGLWCLLNGYWVQIALAAFVYMAAAIELKQVRLEYQTRPAAGARHRPILLGFRWSHGETTQAVPIVIDEWARPSPSGGSTSWR